MVSRRASLRRSRRRFWQLTGVCGKIWIGGAVDGCEIRHHVGWLKALQNPRNHHSWLVETPTKSWNVYHLSTKRLVETLQIILNNGINHPSTGAGFRNHPPYDWDMMVEYMLILFGLEIFGVYFQPRNVG